LGKLVTVLKQVFNLVKFRVHTSNNKRRGRKKQLRYETIEGKLTCYFTAAVQNASFDIRKKIVRGGVQAKILQR
jgi:hypothetical protein